MTKEIQCASDFSQRRFQSASLLNIPQTLRKLQKTEMADQGRPPCPEEAVIVGGTGGDYFSFESAANVVTIKKINVTYSETTLNSIQVIFNCGHMIKVGNSTGPKNKEIVIEDDEIIISAKLWPNKTGDRFGGFEFKTYRQTTFSVQCQELGEPVSLETKCGMINGITGRSGDEINALGFYFT